MNRKIFEPIQIGSMKVKNRLVVSAMVTKYCAADGNATEQYIAYHETKAKGGWGLIITEDYRISELAGASTPLPGLYNNEQISSHRELTGRVHAAGAKIIAQIYHAGWSSPKAITGKTPVSACPVKGNGMTEIPKALTKEKIQEIIGQFVSCAVRAKSAGFDGVEVHGAHGYLINQFFSPLLNSRSDEYGGNFAGRSRLAIDVVMAIREAVGADFPILYRMTTQEYADGGIGLEESKALAILLEEAGVNAFNCSQGGIGSPNITIPPSMIKPGAFVDNAAAIKSVVSVPVIAVGRIHTAEVAEAIVRSGKADLVVMGRASLADPELPLKVRTGRVDEIRHCIGCVQGCIGESKRGRQVSCMVNPMVGRESVDKIEPAVLSKRIFIAGGGVAGCEAAIYAAKRGHNVTLFEKEAQLGGQWKLAAVPIGKAEFASFTLWQQREMERSGVIVRLSTELTKEIVDAEQPTTVVVATGSITAVPPIKGLQHACVTTAHDVLAGKVAAGKKVVVIGGGLVGAETAEFLSFHGSQVIVLEAMDQIMRDGEASPRYFVLQNFKKYEVRVYTSAFVQEIQEAAVVYRQEDKLHTIDGVDTVIVATGVKPYNPLLEELKHCDLEKIAIGDALDVKNGLANIREGYRMGLSI